MTYGFPSLEPSEIVLKFLLGLDVYSIIFLDNAFLLEFFEDLEHIVLAIPRSRPVPRSRGREHVFKVLEIKVVEDVYQYVRLVALGGCRVFEEDLGREVGEFADDFVDCVFVGLEV